MMAAGRRYTSSTTGHSSAHIGYIFYLSGIQRLKITWRTDERHDVEFLGFGPGAMQDRRDCHFVIMLKYSTQLLALINQDKKLSLHPRHLFAAFALYNRQREVVRSASDADLI